MDESNHKPWLILVYIVSLLFYVATVFFASLNSILPIFSNTVGNTSNYFYLEITPASWTFSIWGFIYTYQFVWLVYALTLICRRSKGGYLYANPMVIPTGLWVGFSLASIFTTAWLFTWDRLLVHASFAVLFLAAVSLHGAVAFGHHRLSAIEGTLRDEGLKTDIWLVRLLVLNGLAFYNTWVSIATCLNFAHVMAYVGPYPLPQSAASSGALALLMAVIFLWFILKTVVFERPLRFTWSPFIVLVAGLVGSISKNWDRDNGNSIMTAALLALVILLFIISVINMIIKHRADNKHSALKGDVEMLKHTEILP